MKRALAVTLLLALLLVPLSGCNRTEAEKMSRSYNVIISVELDTDVTTRAVQLEWTVNGLTAGTKLAINKEDKFSKTQINFEKGDIVNFQLREEDLKEGMAVQMKVFLHKYDGTGMSCGPAVPLSLEYGEVYQLRVTGDKEHTLALEQIEN